MGFVNEAIFYLFFTTDVETYIVIKNQRTHEEQKRWLIIILELINTCLKKPK